MISASLVKDLREKTSAGMMDCKKALEETGGDFDAAVDLLRKKGLAAAAKKAGRTAAEGLVGVVVEDTSAAIVEVNSETDFVAMNSQFQNLVKNIAGLAIKNHGIETLNTAKLTDGKTVAESIVDNIASIGENINLRRASTLEVKEGVIASYMHNSVSPGLGKIGVLVALESNIADKDKLNELGKQIAMHIAAARPHSLDVSSLDQSLIQKEREIFTEQSKASGKPDNIIEKMVEGRIRKFFEEVVLLEQIFVIDGSSKISDLVSDTAKKLGGNITLSSFLRFEVGEGIDQEQKSFADEVASMTKH
jgi:elongation factor Ts